MRGLLKFVLAMLVIALALVVIDHITGVGSRSLADMLPPCVGGAVLTLAIVRWLP